MEMLSPIRILDVSYSISVLCCFFFSYSDLEKNNITRITKMDFSGLKNLRVLWV